MFSVRTHRGIVFFVATILLSTAIAHADMWVANFGGASPTVARKFRETDGGFFGILDYGLEVTTGMRLGPDGRIYVGVNALNQGRIARFDAITGAPLGELVTQNQDGYQFPGGFTFGVDGDLYATSNQFYPDGRTGVLKFDGTTGAFGGVFVAPGSGGITEFADVATMPNNDLLVSNTRQFNRHDKTTGAFVATLIADGAGGSGQMYYPTFGPDGNLYLYDHTNHDIRRFNGSTGAFLGTFVDGADLLAIGAGMAFGNDGNLYVSQRGLNDSAVRRYSGVDGSLIDTFVAHDSVYPQPDAIVFTPEPAALGVMSVSSLLILRRKRV